MGIVEFVLELCLGGFASWTVAYEIALLLHLPSAATVVPWLLLFVPTGWFLLKTRRRRPDISTSQGALLAVSLIALSAGAFTLFVHRPDPDDLTFFHRALDQNWRQPFLTGDDTLNIAGLPEESILHTMASYEPLVAMGARALGRNPLAAYQIGAPFLTAVMVVFVYFLGYRLLGLSEWLAAAAVLAACLFLIIDGNNHGSFGNMSLDRLWQGKCIVFTLLIPATTLLCYRFLSRQDIRDFVLLLMVGISGAGLSEVGVFTLPILVLAISLSYCAWNEDGKRPIRRAKLGLVLCASMVYPVAIGLALILEILHKPADPSIWNDYPATWYLNLGFVIGGEDGGISSILQGGIRDLSILLLLPAVALDRLPRRYIVSLGVALLLLIANPIIAPFWMRLLFRNSYWRLAYLFPLPLCAGLLVPAVANALKRKAEGRWAAAAALIFVLLVTGVAFRKTIALPFGPTKKHLLDLQLPLEEAGFSRSIAPALEGRDILGPEQFVWTLALIDTKLRFESTRGVVMPIKLGDVGLQAEAQRRLRAQLYTDCEAAGSDRFSEDFLRSIENGVSAVIVRKCQGRDGSDPRVSTIMRTLPGSWSVQLESTNYVLLLKDPRRANVDHRSGPRTYDPNQSSSLP